MALFVFFATFVVLLQAAARTWGRHARGAAEASQPAERQLQRVGPFCYYATINEMASDDDQDLTTHGSISESLLSLLACPACREPVDQQEGMLRCRGCGLGFPIRDGVPVMLLDEAVPAADEPGERSEST